MHYTKELTVPSNCNAPTPNGPHDNNNLGGEVLMRKIDPSPPDISSRQYHRGTTRVFPSRVPHRCSQLVLSSLLACYCRWHAHIILYKQNTLTTLIRNTDFFSTHVCCDRTECAGAPTSSCVSGHGTLWMLLAVQSLHRRWFLLAPHCLELNLALGNSS